MFVKIIILISVIALMECRQSYYITGPSWNNEIKKCASSGGDHNRYTFHLGTLDSLGLKYDDINESTTIVAHGTLQLYTAATDALKQSSMSLKTYQDVNYYKTFSSSWEATGHRGWGAQISKIVLTIKIHKAGLIELENYVYAGSWWSVTCAQTKAYVNKIEIITSASKVN